MALTIQQLAYALRIIASPTDAVSAGVTLDLTRMQSVAAAYIEADVGTRAPETVRDEAQRLFVGYLYDGPGDIGGAAVSYIDAWRQSGAQALLSRWRLHRAGAIGLPAAAAGGGSVGGGGGGLDQSAVDARVLALVAAWALAGQARPSGGSPGTPGLSQSAVDARFTALLTAWVDQYIPLDQTAVERLIRAEAPTIESVTQLEQFETAMRTETPIITALSTIVATANDAVRFTGVPKVPAAVHDNELVVRVGSGLHHRIDVNVLRAKRTATRPTLLDDTNSVAVVDGDDTFRFAREAGDDALLFSASTAATYLVTITHSQLDLQPEARRSAPKTLTELAQDAVAAAFERGDDGSGADLDFVYDDVANSILAQIKAAAVDVAKLKFDTGKAVAGQVMLLNAAASGFDSMSLADVRGPQLHGIVELHNGSITGITLTSTSSDRVSNLTVFAGAGEGSNKNIGLTGAFNPSGTVFLNSHGEVHYEVSCTIVSPSDTSLSLGVSNLLSPTTTDERSGIAFVSTLNALDAWTVGGVIEGLAIAEWTLNRGNVTLGVIKVYLGRSTANNNNLLGYVVEYDGASGSYTCSFQFHLNMSYVGGDVVSTSAFIPAPSPIATGQLIRKSATGWEAYTLPAASAGGTIARDRWAITSSSWTLNATFRRYEVIITDGTAGNVVPEVNKIVSLEWVTGTNPAVGRSMLSFSTAGTTFGRTDDTQVSANFYSESGTRKCRLQIASRASTILALERSNLALIYVTYLA